jgi:hypothetical protein
MSTKVIRVAVLVTERTRPKDLSTVIDSAFKYDPEILQFAVEGWPEGVDFADYSEAALWKALVDGAAKGLVGQTAAMTVEDSRRRVYERAMACLDVLAIACQCDHGELDFDDPRRSYDAIAVAALRLIEEHGWEEGVAALADMAANLLRQAVGEDDLDRVRELLDHTRRYWSTWAGETGGKEAQP